MKQYLWPLRTEPQTGDVALVIFPHSGGDPNSYRALAKQLSGSINVYGVCYPGRGPRHAEPFAVAVGDIAEGLHGEFAALKESRVVFFGHSLGGLIAYESSLRFASQHGSLSQLIVSGVKSPEHIPHDSTFGRLDSQTLQDRLREIGGLPEVLRRDPDMLAMYLKIIRADLALYNQYAETQTEPAPLQLPLRCFHGDADPLCPREKAGDWQKRTTGQFEHHVFAGDHFYIAQSVDLVAKKLAEVILRGDEGLFACF